MKSNYHTTFLSSLTWFCVITKTPRGWNVSRLNSKGGGCSEGSHNLKHAVHTCLQTGILEECLPEYIEVKGVKFSPTEAVKKFMRKDFWYDRIYPQYQVL